MTWKNVQQDCMLCEMEERTKWYYEDERLVIAEKITDGPFVVWKEHKEEIAKEEREYVEETVTEFAGDDYTLTVLMNICKHHWHAHIGRKSPGRA